MQRNYDFYKKHYYFEKEYVDMLYDVLTNLDNGIVLEGSIRKNGKNLLDMCVCEHRIDLLKKLISPFPYKSGEIVTNPTTLQKKERTRYHYLIDIFTLIDEGFFSKYPSSIMEMKAKYPEKTIEEVSEDIVLLSVGDKREILDIARHMDYEVISNMKIKDVLARQISGMKHPLNSRDDVKYYSEIPTTYPSLLLYDMNIQTLSNDTGGCYDDHADNNELDEVAIEIDYNSLSESNKLAFQLMVAKGEARIGQNGDGSYFYLLITKCMPNDEVTRVISELTQVVEGFTKQDYLYGMIDKDVLVNNLKEAYSDQIDDVIDFINRSTNQEFINFYNEVFFTNIIVDEGIFYKSESARDRHLEYKNTNKLGK